ncbi:MAG: hypothetical protein JWL89_314 [Candidatus Saccharibacteria bacterium]|nr:hypothetical protein [Candidatus Saccharibacteria bacterium]
MARNLELPVAVVTPVDLGRLLRELHLIDETLLQMQLRGAGAEVKMPKTSHLMDQMITANTLNLLHKADRQELQEFLRSVREHAPVLHMSFSADPSVSFMEKLTSWLRREIDPVVLVTVGLQPNIGAGCVLRTTNKHFDLSLREDFAKHRDLLTAKLKPEVTTA